VAWTQGCFPHVMSVDRARVVAVIKAIRDAAALDRAVGVVRMVDPRACEIVRRACESFAITVEEWLAALHADPDLVRLMEGVLVEVVADPPDPGPYDEISRESATGAPEPSEKGFERDARLLGRPLPRRWTLWRFRREISSSRSWR
jgi:hypothetical protein